MNKHPGSRDDHEPDIQAHFRTAYRQRPFLLRMLTAPPSEVLERSDSLTGIRGFEEPQVGCWGSFSNSLLIFPTSMSDP